MKVELNQINMINNKPTKASLIISFTDFHHHFGRSGGGNKNPKNFFVYTTFYFAGIANFLLLFGREEGIKPFPAAAIVW
jgi:hypothetical protein